MAISTRILQRGENISGFVTDQIRRKMWVICFFMPSRDVGIRVGHLIAYVFYSFRFR